MKPEDSKSDPHGHPLARRKVLIVEDNILNMKLFNDVLVAHGYETIQSRDGAQALALARRYRPDLILMDIQLPEASGLRVTKWLKEDEELRLIPVVAVTAFAMKGDEQKSARGDVKAISQNQSRLRHFCKQSNVSSREGNPSSVSIT
jgi:two-component system cell cycle response regulator DivK